jgi:hypothetical protein
MIIENLEDDIRTHGLAYVSWAIQYGYVKDCNGSAFRYVNREMQIRKFEPPNLRLNLVWVFSVGSWKSNCILFPTS